jgi:hypothetical protein
MVFLARQKARYHSYLRRTRRRAAVFPRRGFLGREVEIHDPWPPLVEPNTPLPPAVQDGACGGFVL